jgi:hypothetical protein
MLPTSTGDRAPGIGKSTVKPLPAAQATRLHERAGSAAAAATLEAVATSSELGAPQSTLHVSKAATTRPAIKRLVKPPAAPKPKPKIVSSSVGAVASGDGGLRGKVLLALGALTTIAMAVAAARRHG